MGGRGCKNEVEISLEKFQSDFFGLKFKVPIRNIQKIIPARFSDSKTRMGKT